MKAFLLAAGIGTRLRPLTNDIPKCLLPIGGKPLLQIWLEHLSNHGIDEVLVNTHWHHEKVEEYIRREHSAESIAKSAKGSKQQQRKKWPEIRLFYEPELLGSAGTLLANRDWVADGQPFFILYGDNLTNVNLTRMLAFHRQHGMPFTLGVFKTETPSQCGIAELGEGGVVKGIVEKPENPKSNLAAAGIYVADQKIYDFFPQERDSLKPLDLSFHVLPNLVGRMKAYLIDFLIDIGTADSYERAQKASADYADFAD